MTHKLAAPLIVAILLASTLTVGAAGAGRATAALPLAGVIIAVDPGHNGGAAGHMAQLNRLVFAGNRWKPCNTVGTTTVSGYPEHRFTFAVALRVKARLQALGATVYMTRNNDTGVGPCVDERGKFGSRVHAQLTVSIHGDGAPSRDRGFFVMKPGLVRGYTDDIVARSTTLAIAVRRGLLNLGLPIANYYATNGIKNRTDFGGFNMSDVPVVMVELGNMKNGADATRMKSVAGRDRYAAGLVAGIRLYLRR